MTTLIKTLDIRNAQLNVITAGRRIPLANFCGRIEISEVQNMTPILGRKCKGEKKIYASFILCEDIDYKTDNEFNSGKVYEAIGDVQGERTCERLIFSGLRLNDPPKMVHRSTYVRKETQLIELGNAIWERLYDEYGVKPSYERR